MTTDTQAGNDTSTATADAGTAAKTILDTTGADAGKAADGDAGKTADATADAGKTADADAGADKTTDTGKDADADKAKADGPPEKYEFTMPDGMELDASLAEKADPVFRELGLTNEQANKLAKLVAEQRVSEGQAQHDAYVKQMEDWAKATYADAELGGSETAVMENVNKYVPTFLNEFASPELKALLRDTGLGNHPELVRVFVRAGKAMAEDGGVLSKSKSTPKSAGEVLFDNPTSNHKR